MTTQNQRFLPGRVDKAEQEIPRKDSDNEDVKRTLKVILQNIARCGAENRYDSKHFRRTRFALFCKIAIGVTFYERTCFLQAYFLEIIVIL